MKETAQKQVVIVGGGSAAWSCAAALSCNKNLHITLVDSSKIKSIGVGESSLPIIRDFHKKFRLFEEQNWIERVGGIIKYTLEFEDFMEEKGSRWVHPLSAYKEYEEFMTLKHLSTLPHLELTERFFYTQNLCNTKFSDNTNDNLALGAYHFDAKRYAQELQKIALSRGVEHIDAKIVSINQDENITQSLVLEDDRVVEGDLFIDCSGFQNILFKNLKTNFLSFEERLFCNKAMAIKLPYVDIPKQKRNATLAKALKNGWVWHTPLEDVLALGYVYSGKHTNAQDAKDEFFAYLQKSFGYKDLDATQLHHVEYRSGVHEHSWIGNNIAIGLASFFIEPLESTGIALFEIQIMELARILETNPAFAHNYMHQYNATVLGYILSVKDFIEMHYILSQREDSPFWREASTIEPNALQKKLVELYRLEKFEEILRLRVSGIFSTLSWLHLLHGNKK
ncbi:tryptophan 7-halogenase [bacterium]|nr:tryptophan 7-halogenase [bacterium]MBU1434366.1 tryptophan 7-halogenase [bacterium]MBU1501944.1 tryptophan 7-halogenase [bacterium]